jgi:hypothetical protein
MKMKQLWLIAAAFAAVQTIAHSADAPKKPGVKFVEHFCRPGEEILDSTKSCMDNRVFVDEADKCLDRLHEEAQRVSKGMASGFAKDATAAQSNKFSSSNEDYVYAAATFADLIMLTNQVMDEVDSYADFVNLPEDIMNDEVTNGDADAYAAQHPCYAETQDSIDSVMDDLGDMLQEFTDGKTASDAAAATSASRKTNLDANGSANATAHGTSKSSVTNTPAAKPKSGASDITGVKQDQEKQQQK